MKELTDFKSSEEIAVNIEIILPVSSLSYTM